MTGLFMNEHITIDSFFDVNNEIYHFEKCNFGMVDFYGCKIDGDLFEHCHFYNCRFMQGFSIAGSNYRNFERSNYFKRCTFIIGSKQDAEAFYNIFVKSNNYRIPGSLPSWFVDSGNHVDDPKGFLDKILRKEK